MDFEAVNWDVGNEASELDSSLFQKNKKKRHNNSKKRKQTEKETIPVNGNVNKKRKVSNEGKDTFDEAKSSIDNVGVSNTVSLSRKEKRDKKWQDKILRRKQMSDTKDLNVNKVFPEQESKVTEKLLTNTQSSQMEGAPPMSRTEKRKVKWEKMQQKKRLRLEQVKIDNPSKPNTDNSPAHKFAFKDNERENVSSEGQMNRKERRKLQRKMKLKERKLSMKNEKENSQSVNEKICKEDTKNKDKNDSNSKGQNSDKQGIKYKKKHKKGEKSNKINENKQADNPNKKDMEDEGENESMNKVTDSLKKTKRKRICKRNKFKGYLKPEKVIPKPELDTMGESVDLTRSEKLDQSMAKVTANTEDSRVVSNESIKLNKSMKKKNDSSKYITKELNDNIMTRVNIKKDVVLNVEDNTGLKGKSGKTLVKKGGKNVSLDPTVLKKMLSPETAKRVHVAVDNSVVAKDKIKNYITDDTDDFKRQKRGNNSKVKTLLEKSRERLNAARFRYLNEQLYTTTGHEALKMFKKDDVAFNVYHEGFQSQVEKWPTNPIDVIIEKIQSKPKHLVLADFGCGDAKLARTVSNQVHSYDLVALNDHVTVCDMSKVPLKDSTVDIAVFCLSLMGTNLTSYLKEANRILKNNGTLMIAEVSSRFHSVASFVLKVEKMGFKIKIQDVTNKMFVMMEFKKTADCKNKTVEEIELKPCIYKKR